VVRENTAEVVDHERVSALFSVIIKSLRMARPIERRWGCFKELAESYSSSNLFRESSALKHIQGIAVVFWSRKIKTAQLWVHKPSEIWLFKFRMQFFLILSVRSDGDFQRTESCSKRSISRYKARHKFSVQFSGPPHGEEVIRVLFDDHKLWICVLFNFSRIIHH